MGAQRGDRHRGEDGGTRKKNLELRARWEFGGKGDVARAKDRLARAADRRRGNVQQLPHAPRRTSEPPALLPQNVLAWSVFCSCLDQIDVTQAGTILGVPHSAIDFAFRMRRVPHEREPEVFDKVKHLVSMYAAEINRRATASADRGDSGRASRRR